MIEFEYYDEPFTHKSEMWSYHSNNKYIHIKFVYYFLKLNEPHFQKLGSKMQMPQIATPDTDKFLVPIPCPDNLKKSIEIQREIVRILDHSPS
ncbi:restriction endonuclease subunit S [Roseateles sp. GG27B]